jgi:glycosyltransferase involved in cell wall biosynthesis
MSVSVCIPTIPPRRRLLLRCLASVLAQTVPADEIRVAVDVDGQGSAPTRDRAAALAGTEWLAFVDDDDELLPPHLEKLLACAAETKADLVYPWFSVVNGRDPFPQLFGRQWDPAGPTSTTITFLVRTEVWRAAGGFDDHEPPTANWACNDDARFVARVNAAGARIVHLPERTWRWHWHGTNTGGVPWPGRLKEIETVHAEYRRSILARQQDGATG